MLFLIQMSSSVKAELEESLKRSTERDRSVLPWEAAGNIESRARSTAKSTSLRVRDEGPLTGLPLEADEHATAR